MQTPSKKSIEKIRHKTVKADLSVSRKLDEEVKKNIATPRNYLQTTTTADIYGKKNVDVTQAPKKTFSSTLNNAKNISPMKGYLKSTSSTASVRRTPTKMAAEKRIEAKVNLNSARKTTPRAQAPVNVTVNSPVLRRRSNVDLKKEKSYLSIDRPKVSNASVKVDDGKTNMADIFLRQRSKTRTLDENEVKILKDVVDNNVEMQNLSRKLTAQPKAFYVALNGEAKVEKEKSSEEEIDYEDDFESYESDFDSYHSETQSDANSTSDEGQETERNGDIQSDVSSERKEEMNTKENEENMLDSGSFDLRDQRSAQKLKTPLDFIQEAAEDKRTSLTDEGFQDMSSSSIVSSTKTVHVDVLERPLFIDFAVSKRNKKKRRIFERLQQRANDILSMVTLHEMTYTLFEMQPIPYDLYMATFGRSNTVQVAVQTFDDGVPEEVQTEEILYESKWTQCPVKFSKHNIHVRDKVIARNANDFINTCLLFEGDSKEKYDEALYAENPLRIYLEQKNGVGSDDILLHEIYKSKLKQSDFNVTRLKKFLKRTESRISNILSINAGNTDVFNLMKSTKFPFSAGYVTIPKNVNGISFYSKIINVFFSTNKSNLIVTVHEKCEELKCYLCLWDLSGGMAEPIKVLLASDNVTVGQYRGGVDGIIIAALQDGSIHLWDLSEQATWMHDVTSYKKPTDSVEIDNSRLTQTELDREWNLNSRSDQKVLRPMQISAYTSSGINIIERDVNDSVVALEFVGESSTSGRDDDRKVIAQICSLQRVGILTLWSIVRETSRRKFADIGKAFWSKMALEKIQTIHLTEYLDIHLNVEVENINKTFNLNAAKRRICNKRRETNLTNSRPQSTDRPRSVTSAGNRKMPKNNTNIWETGIVCNDMKIIRFNNSDYFLIAKNCGEVLRCIRYTGTIKVNRFCVANDTSSITRLELSQNGLPLVLAGTESGTINLCSIVDFRVLLTLDCSNVNSTTSEKYKTDSKGRYLSSVQTETRNIDMIGKDRKMAINSLVWPRSNPLDMVASLVDRTVSVWRLTTSDIAARRVDVEALITVASGDTMALVTSHNEVQVYRISSEKQLDNLKLFKRYLALL